MHGLFAYLKIMDFYVLVMKLNQWKKNLKDSVF